MTSRSKALSEDEARSMLGALDPDMAYDGWLAVGMALHAAGLPCDVWDGWSRGGAKWRAGVCGAKWETFGEEPGGVGPGTLVKMARDAGWAPSRAGGRRGRFGIGDTIETAARPAPPAWGARGPDEQLCALLRCLYRPDEHVCVVTDTSSRGVCSWTRDELLARVERGGVAALHAGDAGAWLVANPVDGTGRRDANVTDLRYCLLECDEPGWTREAQMDAARTLGLPVAAAVWSGGKSMHFVCRVDAPDGDEFRARFQRLAADAAAVGWKVDRACRNPARLFRMPGAVRGGSLQELVALGAELPWAARSWAEYAMRQNPVARALTGGVEFMATAPKRPEPVVTGLVDRGCKTFVSGASKSHKTFTVMQLALCVAAGVPFLGFDVPRAGRVAYLDFELKAFGLRDRFGAIRAALGLPESAMGNVDVAALRGAQYDYRTLTEDVIAYTTGGGRGYDMLILDPIYKLDLGDENDSHAISQFTSTMDRLSQETGMALVYTHHQTKGAQGGKDVMDRFSGSGVFARDPDTLMVISNLRDESDEDNRDWAKFQFVTRYSACPPSFNAVFGYPLWRVDSDGVTEGAYIAGSPQDAAACTNRKREPRRAQDRAMRNEAVRFGVDCCMREGIPANLTNVYGYASGFLDERGMHTSLDTFKGWTSKGRVDWVCRDGVLVTAYP